MAVPELKNYKRQTFKVKFRPAKAAVALRGCSLFRSLRRLHLPGVEEAA